VAALSVPAEAERFARLTEPLGVLEVKRDALTDAVIIFVHLGVTQEELDGVRVLAAVEWPKSRVVIARRRSMDDSGPRVIGHIGESGTYPATRLSDDRAGDTG
jgi:hypothetical protein